MWISAHADQQTVIAGVEGNTQTPRRGEDLCAVELGLVDAATRKERVLDSCTNACGGFT
jgi:hypothetical protein